MSGPEGVRLITWPADAVELAAFEGREVDLRRVAAAQALPLPAHGRSMRFGELVVLCVRPARWLLLAPRAAAGSLAASWEQACAGAAAVVDLSGAVRAFALAGPAVSAVLARACRLDLREEAFPHGSAAATIMVQVPVTLAALEGTMLLLTPATTARHLREWLIEAAAPFGVEDGGDGSI